MYPKRIYNSEIYMRCSDFVQRDTAKTFISSRSEKACSILNHDLNRKQVYLHHNRPTTETAVEAANPVIRILHKRQAIYSLRRLFYPRTSTVLFHNLFH